MAAARNGGKAMSLALLLLASATVALAQGGGAPQQQQQPECDKGKKPGDTAAVKAVVNGTNIDVSCDPNNLARGTRAAEPMAAGAAHLAAQQL